MPIPLNMPSVRVFRIQSDYLQAHDTTTIYLDAEDDSAFLRVVGGFHYAGFEPAYVLQLTGVSYDVILRLGVVD